jgi:hypothetical protein
MKKTPLALAALALAPSAFADIIVYKFSGTITSVEGPSPVPIDTPFTFEYRFDSFTPDSDPSPNFGAYTNAISQATVELDGTTMFSAGPGDITVLNNGFAGDSYSAFIPDGQGYAQANLGDLQGAVFNGDDLPSVLTLGPFELKNFYLHRDIGPTFWEARGTIESLEVMFIDCYPDCNQDGVLNLTDFGCFQTAFALGNPYADCNGDGVQNLSDFGCFQTKFALGCP